MKIGSESGKIFIMRCKFYLTMDNDMANRIVKAQEAGQLVKGDGCNLNKKS